MPLLKNLITLIEDFAPSSLAQSWDNVGLQVGDPDQNVEKVLVSLNASPQSLEEARGKNCQLVLTHHPLFFAAPMNITKGSKLYEVIKLAFDNNISIFSAHTNLDKTKNGLNSVLADYFGLEDSRPLSPDVDFKKLVFFVEAKNSKKIISELSSLGAGVIGNYSNASFRGAGVGTFLPRKGAKPSVGDIGKINEVNEERVEMLVHSSSVSRVISKLVAIHPYEEVAYELYPVDAIKKSDFGLGRVGNLKNEKSIKDIAKMFTDSTGSQVKFVGDPKKKISKVAIVAGSGGTMIEQASQRGAELLITADVKYHEGQLANHLGINLIVLSHYALEKLAMNLISPMIADKFSDAGYTVDIMNSKEESDVWIES